MLKTQEDADRVRNECKEMVTRRALLSGGASAVPVPAADALADIAILLEMVSQINRSFGLSPDQIGTLPPSHQAIIYSIIKKAGVTLAGRVVTKQLILQALRSVAGRVAAKQVVKFVPFVGTAVSAVIGFGSMKYVGDKHVEDCFRVSTRLLATPELRT